MIHPDTYFKKPDADCFATVYGWCKYIAGSNKVKLVRSHPNLEEQYNNYVTKFESSDIVEEITSAPLEVLEDSIENGLVEDKPIKHKKVKKNGTNS